MIYSLTCFGGDDVFFANIYKSNEFPKFEKDELILYTRELIDNTVIVENILVSKYNLLVCEYFKEKGNFIRTYDYEVKYVNCVKL